MHAALVAAAPSQPVLSYPGWTARELAFHLIGVHRWARAALDSDSPPPYDESPVTGDIAEAYLLAGQGIVEGLRERRPDAPAWTFDKHNRTAGFWRRRQLHEVAMHRWDLQPYEFEEAVAADGIDEVVSFMLPRQVAAGRLTMPEGTLHLVAPTRTWTVGSGSPEVTVTATASELLLLLWRRGGVLPGVWGETPLTP